jgi:replicative DNA helicase
MKKQLPGMDTMQFGKIPPQAKELEAAVLGAIMVEKDRFDEVAGVLQPDCFYLDAHKAVFQAMCNLAVKHQPIDLLTVINELKAIDRLEIAGEAIGVMNLTKTVVTGVHAVNHARIVFQKYLQREVIRISGELIGLAYEESTDAFELIGQAERMMSDIGMKSFKGDMVHMSSVIMDSMKQIEEWRQNDDSITGIPSGFAGLDKATRGWQPGDLIILAARPSVGKTAFALNLIKHAAANPKRPVTTAVWSLEMKAVYLVLRMLSAESETFLYKIQTGKLSEDDMKSIMELAANRLSRLPIYFDENTNITLQSLSRKARRLKKKEGLGLIVIDYLQLMSGDEKAGNREQEIAKISRGLKNLAQELEIPIIALSQLSRESGAKNVSWEYGPPISSIRESGAIEQDADVILMLWGPTEEEVAKDPSLDGRRKVRIAKQRNGVLLTEELHFRNEIQLFERFEEIIPQAKPQNGNWKPVKLELNQPVNFEEERQRLINEKDDMPF